MNILTNHALPTYPRYTSNAFESFGTQVKSTPYAIAGARIKKLNTASATRSVFRLVTRRRRLVNQSSDRVCVEAFDPLEVELSRFVTGNTTDLTKRSSGSMDTGDAAAAAAAFARAKWYMNHKRHARTTPSVMTKSSEAIFGRKRTPHGRPDGAISFERTNIGSSGRATYNSHTRTK